jgi:hypothetical protein
LGLDGKHERSQQEEEENGSIREEAGTGRRDGRRLHKAAVVKRETRTG